MNARSPPGEPVSAVAWQSAPSGESAVDASPWMRKVNVASSASCSVASRSRGTTGSPSSVMILGAAVIAPLQSGLVGRVTGPAGTRGRPGAARGYDPPPTSAAGSILLVWYSRFPASSGYTDTVTSQPVTSSPL